MNRLKINKKLYTVYKGEINGRLVYIGTTVQNPSDRFRWHKHNGKDLHFTVLAQYQTPNEMLDEEYRLIKEHKPELNKITNRKQNFNVKLSASDLEARRGDAEWCQCCLRRRVNAGYKKCKWC